MQHNNAVIHSLQELTRASKKIKKIKKNLRLGGANDPWSMKTMEDLTSQNLEKLKNQKTIPLVTHLNSSR